MISSLNLIKTIFIKDTSIDTNEVQTYTHIQSNIYRQAYTARLTHTHTRTYSDTHTHTHTHIQTNTHREQSHLDKTFFDNLLRNTEAQV